MSDEEVAEVYKRVAQKDQQDSLQLTRLQVITLSQLIIPLFP